MTKRPHAKYKGPVSTKQYEAAGAFVKLFGTTSEIDHGDGLCDECYIFDYSQLVSALAHEFAAREAK
jgi:hypothetical protein